MKYISIIGFITLSHACLAQNSTQQESISNYFHSYGYNYLQAGHISCDVTKVAVRFADPDQYPNQFVVGITYKDWLDQEFTCYYGFTWNDGLFSNLIWECHSPDVKCFNACNDYKKVFLALLKSYQNDGNNNRNGDSASEIERKLEELFQKSLDKLTCSQLVLGFLDLDYMGKR